LGLFFGFFLKGRGGRLFPRLLNYLGGTLNRNKRFGLGLDEALRVVYPGRLIKTFLGLNIGFGVGVLPGLGY